MARQLLRLLGTRYGMALALLIVVIGVVGVARAISGPGPVEVAGPPPSTPPTATSSGSDLSDDSVATPESPPALSSIPGAAAPDAVALDFTRAWLRAKGVTSADWVKGLQPYATPRLIERLKDADPASVPATDVRGPVQVRARDSVLAEVTVPVTPGVLKLRLVVLNNKWLVDTVAWERS